MDIERHTDNQQRAVCITESLTVSDVPRVYGPSDEHQHQDSVRCRQRRR